MGSSSNPISDLNHAVNKAVNQVGDVGQAIINNPLPIIETAVLTAALGPEGIALSSAIGAPATAAVSAAAVEAANGGNVNQIATAAASAGVGSEVTQLVAPSVTPVEGAATGSTSPVASAAGGAAGGATQAALTGQDIAKGALTGGVVSGGAALGAQGVSAATSSGDMSGTGLTVPTNALPQVSSFENAPTSTEGLKLPSSVFTGEASSPGIQYNLANQTVTPGGVDYGFTQATPTDTLTSAPQTAPGLTKAQQDALQSVFGFGIGTALAPKSTGLGGLGGLGAATTGGGTTGTTSSTTGGAPGGTELDPSTGKAPEKVWGEKYSSLKEGLNV